MVDPTADELQAVNSLDDARAWAGVSGRLSAALNEALGDPARVREIALIPRQCGTPPSRTWRYKRQEIRCHQLDSPHQWRWLGWNRCGECAALDQAARGGAPAAAPGVPQPQARKLKLSAVLDPTLDAEI